MQCPLCHNTHLSLKHKKNTGSTYHQCLNCELIFLDSNYLPTSEIEQTHYLTHNNDIHDPRYQKYASPIVDYILQNFSAKHLGLDYGAGPGPVMKHLLEIKHFKVECYDPYFHPDRQVLNRKYDYIIASEVIEHFHRPSEEFTKLKSLLTPHGQLIMRTELYRADIDFESWYYHQDITHVCFYSQTTMNWIAANLGLATCIFKDKLIIFK